MPRAPVDRARPAPVARNRGGSPVLVVVSEQRHTYAAVPGRGFVSHPQAAASHDSLRAEAAIWPRRFSQETEHRMTHFRLLIAAARIVAVVVAVGLFIKVGPTIASHAAGHSATYQVRSH